MQVRRGRVLAAMILAGASLGCLPGIVRAQDSQFLMPEQSAAKAKELIHQTVDALGGAAYLNLHDFTCIGRAATFEHSGDLMDFLQLTDVRGLPDKARLEYVRKGRNTIAGYVIGIEGLEFSHGGMVITVYNGNHGWSYDRSGVNELPADYISEFRDQVHTSLGNVLRVRVNEPGIALRYGGEDVVDLKPADWVEFTDAEEHTIRIAISRSSHLPVREVVLSQDPKLRSKSEEVTYFSDYHVMGGIQTPLQIAQERNGIKVSQTFWDKCEYNVNPPESAFNRQELDRRWAQAPGKDKAQDKKAADRMREKQKDDEDANTTAKTN